MIDPRRLSLGAQRLLALAMLGLAAILVDLAIVEPWNDARADAAASLAAAQKTQAEAARNAALPVVAIDRDQLAGLLVSGGSVAQRVAGMRDLVVEAARLSGARLMSLQPLPNPAAAPNAALQRIALRLVTSGDLEAMLRLTHNLESGRPLLTLDNLELRQLAGGLILEGRFDVIGWAEAGS